VTLQQEIFTIQMNQQIQTPNRNFSYGPLRYSNNFEINPPAYDALTPPPKYETLKINLFDNSWMKMKMLIGVIWSVADGEIT